MGKSRKNIWQPNQNQCRIGMLVQEESTGRQCDLGAMVASHAVNSNCDHGADTQKRENIRQNLLARNNKSPTLQNLQLRALRNKP
jgi:hypothetical protein